MKSSIEKAKADRKCSHCSSVIAKGSNCVVSWKENAFGRKKMSLCRECAMMAAEQNANAAFEWMVHLKEKL